MKALVISILLILLACPIILADTPAGENLKSANIVIGDANGSGRLNGADVIFLIRYFEGKGPAPANLTGGDVNGDCRIDFNDITYLINYFRGSSQTLRTGDCR